MADEFDSAGDFSQEMLLYVRKTCLYVATLMEDHLEDIVIVGGLVPQLLVEARALPGVRVLDDSVVDGRRTIGRDPTRVTLNVRDAGCSGYEIENALLRFGLIAEMATPDVVLFLVSPSVSASQVDQTLAGLHQIVGKRHRLAPGRLFAPPALPRQVLTSREAVLLSSRRRIPRQQAIGRVCGETIACYPPGAAVLMPGEEITQEAVDYLLRAVSMGGHLKRVHDDHFETIEVVESSITSSERRMRDVPQPQP